MRQVTCFSLLGILFCLVSSETRMLILQVHYKTSNVSHTLGLGEASSHIDFFHQKRHMFFFLGGGVAAVTFLCKHHGKVR